MSQIYTIKEVFKTLQGEGARAGTTAVFVRFAGCNLWSGKPESRDKGKGACAAWCDTDFFKGQPLTAAELLVAMDACWAPGQDQRWCVLTGGEPMLQVDADLLHALKGAGWKVAMETNGTINSPCLSLVDHLTVSPKLGSETKVMNAHELKVVLPGALPPDPGWTEEALETLEGSGVWGSMYVQPQDPIDPAHVHASFLVNLGHDRDKAGIYQLHVQRAVTFVVGHPAWRLSMQTHKLIGVP